MVMKFLTKEGIGKVEGNKLITRQRYFIVVKEKSRAFTMSLNARTEQS